MNGSISVEKTIGELAHTCMREWSAKATDIGSHLVFNAALMEGNRREGVSRDLFTHLWTALSSMTCWEAAELEKPWTSHVTYEIPHDMLEKSVHDLRRNAHALRATLECDSQGNDAEQIVTYLETPPLRLGVGQHASIEVSLERRCKTRNYVKKEATFHKISVEVKKTLTFKEHFDWHYTFTLKYREPYHKTHDLMTDVAEKDMTFCDPPVCFFEISCDGLKDTDDHGYFADSFLCKVTDVLPPRWKAAPLHVKQPLKTGR